MTDLVLQVGERVGDVSALLELPRNARALYVLAHGAGAGMRHRFLQAVAAGLAERQIGTLRYQFPYMEAAGPTRPACSRRLFGPRSRERPRRRPDFHFWPAASRLAAG
jgi:predicted alpha/beta-hydrolase family hydrolase